MILLGTDKILDCLMKAVDNDPSFMLHSIFCLRMPSVARNLLSNILHNVHPPDLLYDCLLLSPVSFSFLSHRSPIPSYQKSFSLMVCCRFSFLISDHQLVSLIRPKKYVIKPQGTEILHSFFFLNFFLFFYFHFYLYIAFSILINDYIRSTSGYEFCQ